MPSNVPKFHSMGGIGSNKSKLCKVKFEHTLEHHLTNTTNVTLLNKW